MHHYLGAVMLDRQVELAGLGTGSTGQTELSRTALGRLPVLVPPMEIQEAFVRQIAPMRALITGLSKVIASALASRDLVVPRLISGSLDVSNLDIQADEAVA